MSSLFEAILSQLLGAGVIHMSVNHRVGGLQQHADVSNPIPEQNQSVPFQASVQDTAAPYCCCATHFFQ